MKTDILIVGCGVAGLYAALCLPRDKNVTVITKSAAEECDSQLAQGGICVKRDENDFDSFYEDTLRAGHFENDPEAVTEMIEQSRSVIDELLAFGVDFDKRNGELSYTKEGAHSKPRILFHKDVTGKAITSVLLYRALERENITLIENCAMIDLLFDNNTCFGTICEKGGETFPVYADYTLLATGGVGGLFTHSTNFSHLTADSLALAEKYGIELKDADYVQIHPTTLYTKKTERAFLISESVRGEGALLLDKNGNRFTDELMPRDKVTAAIYEQMQKDGTEHVWLSLAPIPRDEILSHFPNIYNRCVEEGYDPLTEPIPVVPAQHYYMGGIKIDLCGRTSAKRLYAAGETACNGVHGRNRLASNSLLESLVFARNAARNIAENFTTAPPKLFDIEDYEHDLSQYRKAVCEIIKKEKN